MADSRSPYAVLAELFTELPAIDVLGELARRLAADVDATTVSIWRAFPAGLGIELRRPEAVDPASDGFVDPAKLVVHPGVDAVAMIRDGALVHGAVTITSRVARPLTETAQSRLADTANCVLLLWRREELRAAVDRQVRHTNRLTAELADSGRRLSIVRELERRRVASEIITLSTGRLGQLERQAQHLESALATGQLPATSSVDRLRDLLDTLIEDFRIMVRGIHPQVLRDRGHRAALAEVVAGLARPTRITGTVPARVDQELGASLYYLTASALLTLAGAATSNPRAVVEAHLSHFEGGLRVLVTAETRLSAAQVRAALTIDSDRMVALGGRVEVRVEDAVVTLRAWVPDRLEPAAEPSTTATVGLPARVRMLALNLAARNNDQPISARSQALVSRLDGPVRLGVARTQLPPARDTWLSQLERSLPEIQLVSVPPDDPDDRPDAVLQPSAEYPDQRVDLLLPGSGVLLRAGLWTDLAELLTVELVARADLLRARSALTTLAVLLRELPATDTGGRRLRYELEELQAGAHELAELDALAELHSGALDLSRSQLRTADRLLGRFGTAPSERLGLLGTAGPAELIQAATEQMEPWRLLAENAAGRRQRLACSVIVHTCERLLAEAMGSVGSERDEALDRRPGTR